MQIFIRQSIRHYTTPDTTMFAPSVCNENIPFIIMLSKDKSTTEEFKKKLLECINKVTENIKDIEIHVKFCAVINRRRNMKLLFSVKGGFIYINGNLFPLPSNECLELKKLFNGKKTAKEEFNTSVVDVMDFIFQNNMMDSVFNSAAIASVMDITVMAKSDKSDYRSTYPVNIVV